VTKEGSSNKYKYGWLEKLFPQRILYQVTAQQLMVYGILSKPEIEQYETNFEAPKFEEKKYKKWSKSYQNLPEYLISKLVINRDRTAFFAETYASNKERYEKTIIFAAQWFQCEQLRDFLEIEVYVLALFILELKALKERNFARGMRMPVY
jgi:superfamily II DNA or RNA helicase